MSEAAALARLAAEVPMAAFLGLRVEPAEGGLAVRMPFREDLVGNPLLPALHGGATAALLEVAAALELAWRRGEGAPLRLPLRLPRTITLTVDYLRPGRPQDAFARARVTRAGRRFASVLVEAWQEGPERPFAQATGHLLMPQEDQAAAGGARRQ